MNPLSNDDIEPHILIIDDSKANILVLQEVLAEIDCTLIPAYSGNEALAISMKYPWACIFVDVNMPDMDGFEVARYLHENKETSHVPIVLISAVSHDEVDFEKGYESGAVDCIIKPINPYVLRSKARIFIKTFKQQYKLQTLLNELDELANIDPLTSLCNRRQFHTNLEKTLSAAKRFNRKFAILWIDMDDFKEINDTLGHDYGDLLLQEFAKRLEGMVRSEDCVARMGGDEFAIVLTEFRDVINVSAIAERAITSVTRPYRL